MCSSSKLPEPLNHPHSSLSRAREARLQHQQALYAALGRQVPQEGEKGCLNTAPWRQDTKQVGRSVRGWVLLHNGAEKRPFETAQRKVSAQLPALPQQSGGDGSG